MERWITKGLVVIFHSLFKEFLLTKNYFEVFYSEAIEEIDKMMKKIKGIQMGGEGLKNKSLIREDSLNQEWNITTKPFVQGGTIKLSP